MPAGELVERFSRSSGPGGQGVNTADSRVELELDVVTVGGVHRRPSGAACSPALEPAARRRAGSSSSRRPSTASSAATGSRPASGWPTCCATPWLPRRRPAGPPARPAGRPSAGWPPRSDGARPRPDAAGPPPTPDRRARPAAGPHPGRTMRPSSVRVCAGGQHRTRVGRRHGPATTSRPGGPMCRWLAYSGSPVLVEDLLYKPANSLVVQSQHSRLGATTINGDGFGVGWYGADGDARAVPQHRAGVERPEPARAERPREGRAGLRPHPRLDRHAVQQTNCHPFRHGHWLWMHNGVARRLPRRSSATWPWRWTPSCSPTSRARPTRRCSSTSR